MKLAEVMCGRGSAPLQQPSVASYSELNELKGAFAAFPSWGSLPIPAGPSSPTLGPSPPLAVLPRGPAAASAGLISDETRRLLFGS